jgi:putative addiction module component (TIGR02574 family)
VNAVNAKTSALRNELLALPTEDRAVLAAELLASLDDEVSDADPAEIDRAWGDEMVRRSEQIATGEVTTLSWSEVLEQIAARRSSR